MITEGLVPSKCLHRLRPLFSFSPGGGGKLCPENGGGVSLQERPAHLPHQQLRHDAQRAHGELPVVSRAGQQRGQVLNPAQTSKYLITGSVEILEPVVLVHVSNVPSARCDFVLFRVSARRGQQTTARRWKDSSSFSWPGRR